MARQSLDNAIIVQGYDKSKLKPGKYLVKLVDCREVRGGYNGDRYQFDFEIVKGRCASPGTVKGEVVMIKNPEALSGKDKEKAQKDLGKAKIIVAAFLNVKPDAVTNQVMWDASREQVVRSVNQQTEVVSESCKPEATTVFGKLAVCVVETCILKTGKNAGKKSGFYRFEPFRGDDSIFPSYDPASENETPYEDDGDSDDKYEQANEGITRRPNSDAAPTPPDAEEPPPPVEDEPLTKAAKAGWAFNTKSPAGSKWYFNKTTKEQLKESDLIKKFTA